MRLALSVLAALSAAAPALAAIAGDQITSLPGWSGALPSRQYSGYLTVDPKNGRNLHYWFVEAETNPGSAPVVLWLNGGPGCSSLDGYLYEHGPFHVNEDDHTQLYYNNYTWTKTANVIYLEAPAGVGFSYSQNPLDYFTNDTKTANDNFLALQAFFAGFPEYASNDFYISGESYAGIYVPTLADRVRVGNQQGQSHIPLRGILVGNGCSGIETGTCGPLGDFYRSQFCYGKGLYPKVLFNQINATCGNQWANESPKCQELLLQQSDAIGNVNIYNILAPCINSGIKHPNPKLLLKTGSTLGGPSTCIDGGAASDWLNQDVVTQALHVAGAKQYWKTWEICTGNIIYTPNTANLPRDTYPGLINLYKVLIFNGDVDACIPFQDNEDWTSGMGYPVSQAWRPWQVESQVAGYVTSYTTTGNGSFAFITVKGAGHMVPQFMPVQALAMFQRFLANQPF